MGALVNSIRKNVPKKAIKRNLSGSGCRLTMENLPEDRLIVDLDKVGGAGDESRADFLFVSDNEKESCVVPIEMKKGSLDSKIIKQLQAAADQACEWTGLVTITDFIPVVASGSVLKHDRGCLREKIRFGSKNYSVRRLRCGAALAEIFKHRTGA